MQEKLQQALVEHDALIKVQEQQALALAATNTNTRSQGLTETVQRQEVVLAGLGSEKLGLEPRLTDRAYYQESVAQQHGDERQATEQRQQCLEHELTELRQHLLAQQTRLGGLQTQEQRLAQDNDRLQNTLLRAKDALTQSRSAHEHLVFQFAAAAENAAPA